MHRIKRQENFTTGNRTLLVLSVTAALAAMASMTVQASTTVSGDSTVSGSTTNVTWNGTSGLFLVNSGVVVSGSPALTVNVTSGSISNDGTITGTTIGISNSGNITTLSNNAGGTISGATAIKNSGTIGTLSNSGTITGSSVGINIASGTIDTLNNSGLISGSTRALDLASGGSLNKLVNTGIIAGMIDYNNSGIAQSPLTITGGAIGSNVFGTLTGSGGGIGAGNISAIAATSGVVFNGNQLLNDGINAIIGGVSNNGVLQVNNPVLILGSYTQGSGATLIIGVVSAGSSNAGDLNDTGYGRLLVTNGNAVLDNSSVTIKRVSYNLAQGQRYVVVATNRTLSANNVTYSAAGYTATGTIQTDTSDSSYQDLVVTLSSSGGSGSGGSGVVNRATNSNSAAVLNGLFNYSGTNANLLSVFNPAAALGTTDAANKAGAQLSPVALNNAATQSARATTQAINNVIASRMDGLRLAHDGGGGNEGSGVATGEITRNIAAWGQVFDGNASQDKRDGISGYHGNYHGLLLGADAQVSDSLRAGSVFSAAKTSVAGDDDNTGSSANVNSYGLTAYAIYSGAPWYVTAVAGVSRQQYSSVRNINFTGFSGADNGSFNGRQYTTAIQAGYPLNLDAWLPGATLTPLAGLNYTRQYVNSYTESGSAAALTVNATSGSSLKSELGARLERGLQTSHGKLLPSVELGWRHEFKSDRMQTGAGFAADSTGSTAFVVQSATPVSDIGVLNLGLTLLKNSSLSLTGKYTLETGGGYLAQTGSVQIRWQY